MRCVRRGADDYDQGDYDDNLEDYDDNLKDHHDHFENDDNVGCEGYSYVLRRYYRLQCSGLHHSHLLSLQLLIKEMYLWFVLSLPILTLPS